MRLMRLFKSGRLILFPAAGLLFFSILNSGCERSVTVNFTTRDIIRFLIRDNPGIFSNSFLDTTSATVSGTGISFSRSYIIKTRDTIIVLNDTDTLSLNPLNVVPKAPREAGADIIDTLIGVLRITDSTGTRTRSFPPQLISKFGYFQKLQSDAFPNRGWEVLGATQTFVGIVRILDSVQIVGVNSNRDTLVIRQNRNTNLDPLNDPQVFKVRTNPYQLKPQDSVEVRAWLRETSIDSIFHVFCHINDFSAKRRIQLEEIDTTTNEFFGGFKLAPDARLDYNYWRVAVDVITNSTLADSFGSFYNEIWGIMYQVHP